MRIELDEMELDDLGIPEPHDYTPCPCWDCGAKWGVDPATGSMKQFHYDNCYYMNPENFLEVA